MTNGTGTPYTKVSGDTEAWTLLANVLYDFMPDSQVTPFVGVGGGLAYGKGNFIATAPAGMRSNSSLVLTNVIGQTSAVMSIKYLPSSMLLPVR